MSTLTNPTGNATHQLLHQVLNELAGHHATHNQRREPRFEVGAPVLLGVLVGQPAAFKPLYRAWATDLSHHGIGLICEHDLPAHTQAAVNLEPLARRPCLLPLRVVYCRQLLPHTYRVGAMFLHQDHADDAD